MGFAGNLKTVGIGDVLQLISTGRRTGALVLQRPHRGKKVFFRNGDIIAASSDPPTDEERLGQLLLRRGLITVENLEKALRRQRASGRRLGQVIVDLGLLGRDETTNALRLQVEEVVYGVFGWTDGEFHFNEGEGPEGSQILVELNALSVMMEGARRFDEYAGIASTLPAEETVLRIVPSPHMQESEIVLSAEDVDVLSAITGHASVGDIVASSSYGEYAASKSLHKLMTAHLVEASPEVAGAAKQKADEDELFAVLYRLYSHSLDAVHATLAEAFGTAGEELFYRLPEACPVDPGNLVPALMARNDKDGLETFRDSVGRLSAPLRVHRAMVTGQTLLREGMRVLRDTLGPNVAGKTAATIQKELSVLLAQKRALVDRYSLQDELHVTLKGK
jgi:predicted transcriptional regulator